MEPLASVVLSSVSDKDSSILFALFLAFAIAAVIWLIIWLLSDGEEDGSAAPAKKAPARKPATKKAAASAEIPADFKTASAGDAAKLFSAELSEGTVEQDSVYGIIYKKAPSEVDDLKKVSGIAKVLEGKLNGIGVYRFKQVAVWTDEACQEFSKMLTFKNRIYSDNWIKQAKALHEEKYGEKL